MTCKVLRKKMKKFVTKMTAISCIIATAFSTKLPVNAATQNPNLSVHYFNVGLGTCAIVEKTDTNSKKHYMLIDTGMKRKDSNNKEYALNNVKTWIANERTKLEQTAQTFKFDYVIISHYDSDHVKNLEEILNLHNNYGSNKKIDLNDDIPVDQFIARKYSEATMSTMLKRESTPHVTYRNYVEFANTVYLSSVHSSDAGNKTFSKPITFSAKNKTLKTLIAENPSIHKQVSDIAGTKIEDAKKQKKLKWINPTKNHSFTFANDVTIKFYSLNNDNSFISKKKNKKEYAEIGYSEAINDDSLVFKIKYKNSSFWFLNDIKKLGMQELLTKKTKKADFNKSVILIPHHGIHHNTITKSIETPFQNSFQNAKIFVRSISKDHADSHDKDKQKKQYNFMKIFKKAKLKNKPVLTTYQNYSNPKNTGEINYLTISTTGKETKKKLYNYTYND